MLDLSKLVSNNDTLRTITDLFDEETYLVGGCIRDMLLGNTPQDLDVVTFGDVWQKARQIGERFASKAFWMDKDRGVVRIALKEYGQTIDVCSPKGADLVEDLKKRDITINAMGFDVSSGELIDPAGGLLDLGHGVIRIISEENLKDDPLRVIRCLRFSVMLGFAIVESTNTLLKKHASAVLSVSPERIKQEFLKALSCPYGARFFSLMDRVGLLEMLFGSEQGMGSRGTRPALILAFEMDGLLYDAEKLLPGSRQALDNEVEAGLTRAGFLRLAAVLYGIGRSLSIHEPADFSADLDRTIEYVLRSANTFFGSLRFSTSAKETAKRIISCQAILHDMLVRQAQSGGSIHTICRAADPFLPEVLLLARAGVCGHGVPLTTDQEASRMKDLIERIWAYQTHTYLEHKHTPLISGEDVIHTLGVTPGPQVGRILHIIEMARADGALHTRKEALEFLTTIDL
ncbi:MAG TPA: hypothetical protein PLV78_07800 [Deltaproteobacteria bacterium]|nr:hypothetical protein [Deltaproteobacteria bacterium]